MLDRLGRDAGAGVADRDGDIIAGGHVLVKKRIALAELAIVADDRDLAPIR